MDGKTVVGTGAGDLPVPKPIAVQYSRSVELALIDGHRDRAYAMVDNAFKAASAALGKVTEDSRLDEVLPDRYVNKLYREGVRTVGQLIRKAPHELVSIGQFRWRSVEIISEKLLKHGFRLGVFEERSSSGNENKNQSERR